MKKRLSNLIFFSFTLVLSGYIGFIGIKTLVRYHLFNQDIQQLTSELSDAKRKNHAYLIALQLTHSPRYWEYQAKDKLNMIFPDEWVYLVY